MKQGVVEIFSTFVLLVTIMFCGSMLYADGSEKELGWASGAVNKGTLYVAHWKHTPENCPGRSGEGAKMLSKFWEGRKKGRRKGD